MKPPLAEEFSHCGADIAVGARDEIRKKVCSWCVFALSSPAAQSLSGEEGRQSFPWVNSSRDTLLNCTAQKYTDRRGRKIKVDISGG